jgi:hypothetical protein
MMKKRAVILMSISALLIAFAGCVSLWPRKQSGFLVDYSSLRPDPGQEDILFFRNPQKSPELVSEQYPAVTIAPVVVYFDSDVVGLAVDPEELQALVDRFKQDLAAALAKNHKVVDLPAPNVARVRIAFSGVALSRFRLSPHPSLAAIDLGDASLEAEMVDSKTAERISALMDTRKRGEYVKLDEATIRRNAEAVSGDWVNLIAGWVDSLYAVPEPAPEPAKGDEGVEKSP